MANLWSRQQNKKAKDKKERAKNRGTFITDRQKIISSPASEILGTVFGKNLNAVFVRLGDKIFNCRLPKDIDLAVGDFVAINLINDVVLIIGRLERKSWVARITGDWSRKNKNHFSTAVLAANIDCGVIVVSVKEPDFHPRFIDRYLIILESGQVPPVICVNKSDLLSRVDEVRALYGQLNIPIFEVSTYTGAGLTELKKFLRGKTAVFVGHSGVGKSSIVKIFAPEQEIQTQTISAKTGTGRHVTTVSEMYEWEKGSFIIDTPGIRSLGLEQIPKSEIRFFFHEFDQPARFCRFKNCQHFQEVDCAVKDGVESGGISRERYESYVRLLGE